MRRILLAATVLLAACSDVEGGYRLSTGPVPATEQQLSTVFASRLSPEEGRVALEIIEQIYAERGMPFVRGQIAVTQNDLPGGALAVIARDPANPEQPTLVVSSSHLTDEVIVRGVMAYAHEADVQNQEEGTAWITVGPEFNEQAAAPAKSSSSATGPRSTVSDRLWRDASSVTHVTIPGIGPATLFRFD